MSTVGHRLKKLRIENNYSQRQIAEYLEINQSNLSKIENGKRNLNLILLDKVCFLYNCTPEYLLGETDLYEKSKIAFKAEKNIDLNVIAKINQLSFHLKTLRNPTQKNNIQRPKLNVNLKRQLGFDDYSPINIFNLIPQKIQNLTLGWFPMKNNVLGCCFKQESDSIILINSSQSKGSQNFTLAHELFHLLSDGSNSFICSDYSEDEVEKKADEFASQFLMSDKALYDFIDVNNIHKWTIDNVIKCEQYFQIDHENLLIRLYDEELIDKYQFKKYNYDISNKASLLGYDISLYEPTPKNKNSYFVGHMIPLVQEAYEKRIISKGRKKDIFIDLFRPDIAYY